MQMPDDRIVFLIAKAGAVPFLSKVADRLDDFEDAVHNFVRVHSSLRVELPEPQGRRKWRQRTPAMVAGLTDHVWSIRELVTYRLPARL